jgi:hypothetical protein
MEEPSDKAMADEGQNAGTERSKRGRRLRSLQADDDLEHLNARIPYDLMTQLRVYCAQNRASLQSAVTEAIEKMLVASREVFDGGPQYYSVRKGVSDEKQESGGAFRSDRGSAVLL